LVAIIKQRKENILGLQVPGLNYMDHHSHCFSHDDEMGALAQYRKKKENKRREIIEVNIDRL
jgi:hypothetical protein